MEKAELEVDYGSVVDKFRNHLKLKHNKHILFSGSYGIGKSTFLRQFFKNHKEYYTIRSNGQKLVPKITSKIVIL